VPTFLKPALAIAAAILPFTAASAQVQLSTEQQKQAQDIFQEHKAMQMAVRVHRKCQTLDTLTETAALITSDMRRQALINLGAASFDQIAGHDAGLQASIDKGSCDTLKANPNIGVANERAIFYKDFYLYVWHEYREVAATRIILSSSSGSNGSLFDDSKFACAGYSFDQIGKIKPLSDAAWQVMKTKGQFSNARAEAEKIIEACQKNLDEMKSSPAVRMLEAGFKALEAKD